jgi:hypothetical protein
MENSLKNYKWGHAYVMGLLSWLRALTCSTMGYCYWWEDEPVRQFVHHKNNFGWMDVWELNPEGMGLLCLKASVTWEEVILVESLHD